jgi:hypothetical protein
LQRKKCNIIYYTIHHISLEEVNVANPYLQRRKGKEGERRGRGKKGKGREGDAYIFFKRSMFKRIGVKKKKAVLVCVYTWIFSWLVGLMVFNATFNNIPVISLQSVSRELVEYARMLLSRP